MNEDTYTKGNPPYTKVQETLAEVERMIGTPVRPIATTVSDAEAHAAAEAEQAPAPPAPQAEAEPTLPQWLFMLDRRLARIERFLGIGA